MAMEREEKIRIVESLYLGLTIDDTETVTTLLATDLEWWFHGPPGCEHMMRVLTGAVAEERDAKFRFVPKKVVEVGKWLIAEGWEGDRAYWVHLWAIEGGVITQFREYFNTSVTVRELGRPVHTHPKTIGWTAKSMPTTVWQSATQEHLDRSLPGLILAI